MNAIIKIENCTIEINYDPNKKEFSEILSLLDNAGVEVIDMQIQDSNLEDVFLKLTKT